YNFATTKYQWIAKLNFNLNENNALTLHYIGAPSSNENFFDPNFTLPATFNGNESYFLRSQNNQVHDIGLHFVSKLLDRKLQIDVLAGYHYEFEEAKAGNAAGNMAGSNRDTRTMSLIDFEADKSDCMRQMIHGVGFNPCPV